MDRTWSLLACGWFKARTPDRTVSISIGLVFNVVSSSVSLASESARRKRQQLVVAELVVFRNRPSTRRPLAQARAQL